MGGAGSTGKLPATRRKYGGAFSGGKERKTARVVRIAAGETGPQAGRLQKAVSRAEHPGCALARKQGLSILQAEVIAEQTKVVKAFESLGFKAHTTLDDYFLFPDGETRDVVFMTMSLRAQDG